MVARSFVAHGRVQGVFFRDSLRQAAEARGVAGWARNEDDGTVAGVLEGDAADVEALLDVVRDGPGRASVARVDVQEAEPSGATGFRVA